MSKVAILTDSSSDMPEELAAKYDIDVLGFSIALDGKEYIERESCTYDEFYNLMRQAQGVPTTAAITTLQFEDVFEAYLARGYDEVLCMLINKTGSATYNNAQMAWKMVKENHPDCRMKVRFVDSRTYSMTFGYYLAEAARIIRNGAEVEYAAGILEQQMAKDEICLAAFTLKQMKKSGRISAAAAFAGELLGLRPVISLVDGKTKVENKVRGDAAVLPAMVKYVKSRVDDVQSMEYQIGYTDDKDRLKELEKLCKKEFGHAPVCTFKLGGVVSANTGPDAIAITFMGRDRGARDE